MPFRSSALYPACTPACRLLLVTSWMRKYSLDIRDELWGLAALLTSYRLDLIMRITDYMRREYTWDRIGFILANYDLSMSENDPLEHDLAAATDDQLLDMAHLLELDLRPALAHLLGLGKSQSVNGNQTVSERNDDGAAEPLFVFASHLSDHKAIVGDVGRELAKFGIHLFVAHDTIEHDKLWQEEIEAGLDRADAAVVFVHPGLRNSSWCDQEIGWLQGRKVPVMALRFNGETPYGFFAKYQAQPVDPSTTSAQVAEMILDRISTKPTLSAKLGASLTISMRVANSFDESNAIWKRLRDVPDLDATHCAHLLESAKINNQIHWAQSQTDLIPMARAIIAFLRRQPGGAAIAVDVDAYAAYLDERDAKNEGVYSAHHPPDATVQLYTT